MAGIFYLHVGIRVHSVCDGTLVINDVFLLNSSRREGQGSILGEGKALG